MVSFTCHRVTKISKKKREQGEQVGSPKITYFLYFKKDLYIRGLYRK